MKPAAACSSSPLHGRKIGFSNRSRRFMAELNGCSERWDWRIICGSFCGSVRFLDRGEVTQLQPLSKTLSQPLSNRLARQRIRRRLTGDYRRKLELDRNGRVHVQQME